MREYFFAQGLGSLFVADTKRAEGFERLNSEQQEAYIGHIVFSCLATRGYALGAYIKNLAKLRDPRIGILDAHGYNPNTTSHWLFPEENWNFVDDGRSFSVSRFIEEYDSRFNTLLLLPCNPQRVRVYSNRAVLVYSTDNNSTWDLALKEQSAEVYIPGRGVVKRHPWWGLISKGVDYSARVGSLLVPDWRKLPSIE